MNRIKINYKGLIYPLILIVVIIIIVILALLTIQFITAKINSSFNTNESALNAGIIKIDMEGYKLTAKKLNIQYPALPN